MKYLVGDWVEDLGCQVVGEIVSLDMGGHFPIRIRHAESEQLLETRESAIRLWRNRDEVLLHLGCDYDFRPGFINLDPKLEPSWRFEDGFPEQFDWPVTGITISHAIQCCDPKQLLQVFREFHRILYPGGVLRITDDETLHTMSSRYGITAPGAKWATGEEAIRWQMQHAGFRTILSGAENETLYPTRALMINHRVGRDYTFTIEAKK